MQELPTFVGHVENKTVRAGNSVILTCQVRNLGNYKVKLYPVYSQSRGRNPRTENAAAGFNPKCS